MDNFQIETAQNISINQNVAHLTTRIGSYLIDRLIIVGYIIIIVIIMNLTKLDNGFDAWVAYLLFGLPIFFYTLIFEMLMNGQTPGKHFNKIRVVKLDGSKPTFSSYLLRWMLNFIDFSLSSGSVAIVSILLTGKGQRLGDLAAGTTVISEKKRVSIAQTVAVDLPENYVPRFPQVTVLTDKDMQTIKSVYYKAKRKRNHKVLMKLHAKIINLTQIKTDLNAMDFIEIVLKDYSYYTQQ
ncbi:RDD family protein [Polaribacter uvawellassae]|uniref:RDD family protein n=1 Tax=Polaribacter uvawellassae TaxID=3133495 RepID=UPI00321A3ECA